MIICVYSVKIILLWSSLKQCLTLNGINYCHDSFLNERFDLKNVVSLKNFYGYSKLLAIIFI